MCYVIYKGAKLCTICLFAPPSIFSVIKRIYPTDPTCPQLWQTCPLGAPIFPGQSLFSATALNPIIRNQMKLKALALPIVGTENTWEWCKPWTQELTRGKSLSLLWRQIGAWYFDNSLNALLNYCSKQVSVDFFPTEAQETSPRGLAGHILNFQ